MLKNTPISGTDILFDPITAQKNFGSIREKWRWECHMTCVVIFRCGGAKVALWGHGGCTSNRPKSGYACPFGKLGTSGYTRPWGTGRAPQTGPASIIRNAMAVCARKHVFRSDPLTHPTNPEVAACRAPVFGLRFLLSVSTVFRANLASGPLIFLALYLAQGTERGRHVPVLF